MVRLPTLLRLHGRRPLASSTSPAEERARLDVFSDVSPADGFYSFERDAHGALSDLSLVPLTVLLPEVASNTERLGRFQYQERL
jgi:hypothetical protein